MAMAEHQRPPAADEIKIAPAPGVHDFGPATLDQHHRLSVDLPERPDRTVDTSHQILQSFLRSAECGVRSAECPGLGFRIPHSAFRTALNRLHFSMRMRAASLAQYVMRMSAPARLIANSISHHAGRSAIQPRAAAAFTIAYSPLTLNAATGWWNSSFMRRMTSRYASAGLTMRMSAPSSISSIASRSASSALAISI